MRTSRSLTPYIALALSCLLLSACVYQPLYGKAPRGISSDRATGIEVSPAANRTEQVTRSAILDELAKSGIRAGKRHRLSLKVSKSKVPFALRSDESPTRYDITLTVAFQLTEEGAKTAAITASNRARASYDVVRSDFNNISSDKAATKRAAALVARQIVTRLGVHFRKQ